MIAAHRRFGKTVLAINEGQKRIFTIKNDNPRVGYIAPTYKMAKNIAWDYLKYYSHNIIGKKINESELKIDYFLPNQGNNQNTGRFQLFGADNPDSLRGLYFDFVILDEYSLMPPNLFSEIIRPELSDRQGGAMWIGTFKSNRDIFYKLYNEKHDESWYVRRLPLSETKYIDELEISDIRTHMEDAEYLQEYELLPMDFVKGAYFGERIRKAQEQKRITSVPYDRSLPVHTVWDLGISDDMAIGFFQVIGREPRMIDFYSNSGYGLDHYVEELRKKPYIYGKHIAPHDINVRELSSGKSRKEIATSFGINFEVAPQVSVKDGIDAARILLDRLWIDEQKCSPFIDAVLQYRREWDDKRMCFKDNPLHDWTSHAADVLRYFALSENIFKVERLVAHQFKPNYALKKYY